jgi:hypothetical protein
MEWEWAERFWQISIVLYQGCKWGYMQWRQQKWHLAFSQCFFLGIFGIQSELQYPGVLSKIIRNSFIQNEVFPSFFIGQDTVETVL